MAVAEVELLVHDARAGDEAAFGRLYELYRDQAYFAALRVLDQAESAEDVAHDAFERAFNRLDTLNEPAAFPGWIGRIASNLARNSARRASWFELEDDTAVFDVADSAPDGSPLGVSPPGRSAEVAEMRNLIRGALSALDGRDRQVVELMLDYDMRNMDIAGALGITHKHANVVVARCRKRFKHALSAYVLWHDGEPLCARLRQALDSAPASFDADIARRVNRHAAVCRACRRELGRCLDPATLYGALPGPLVAGRIERFLRVPGEFTDALSGLLSKVPTRLAAATGATVLATAAALPLSPAPPAVPATGGGQAAGLSPTATADPPAPFAAGVSAQVTMSRGTMSPSDPGAGGQPDSDSGSEDVSVPALQPCRPVLVPEDAGSVHGCMPVRGMDQSVSVPALCPPSQAVVAQGVSACDRHPTGSNNGALCPGAVPRVVALGGLHGGTACVQSTVRAAPPIAGNPPRSVQPEAPTLSLGGPVADQAQPVAALMGFGAPSGVEQEVAVPTELWAQPQRQAVVPAPQVTAESGVVASVTIPATPAKSERRAERERGAAQAGVATSEAGAPARAARSRDAAASTARSGQATPAEPASQAGDGSQS